MLKAEVETGGRAHVVACGSCVEVAANCLVVIQSVYDSIRKGPNGEKLAKAFREVLAVGLREESSVWAPPKGKGTSFILQGAAAAEALRAYERGQQHDGD